MATQTRVVTAAIDRSSPLPYYEQLRQALVRNIEDNGMAPGDLLPSEAELCEMYGVSRTVVRQAVGELVTEGRLRRQRGKGTFVAEPKLHEQFMQSTVGFFDDLTSRGHEVRSRVLACELAHPPTEAARALSVDIDELCVELTRLRSVNGEVIAYTRSYLPTTLGPNLLDVLASADLETMSLYHVLDEAGIQIASGTRALEAVSATRRIAELLGVEDGAAVLYIESLALDATERPVEYFEAWHRGDRARVEINVLSTNGARSS